MAIRPAIQRCLLGVTLVATLSAYAAAQETPVIGPQSLTPADGPSAAYPNGTFTTQLSAASQGGDGPVGGAKYRPGSGRRDDWNVGPHWRATVDGVLLFRSGADLDAILAQVEPIEQPTPADPVRGLPGLRFQNNFDHAAGVRLMLTSEFPQCAGYELQVGYLGLEKWLANAYWERETIPTEELSTPDLPIDVAVEQQRTLGYESSLHSLEVNFQQVSRGYLKPFAGVRYIGLDETIDDENRQFTVGVLPDPVNVGDTIASATTQTRNGVQIDNDLIGFQGGVRLEMWRPTRKLSLNGFVSAGVYCNIVDRDRIFQDTSSVTTKERVEVPDGAGGTVEQVDTTTTTTTVTSKVSADGTRIAFTGEASLAGVWTINNSTSLRAGYQVLFLDGIELAEDLWTSPPPVTAVDSDLFLHGWFAGLEYRR